MKHYALPALAVLMSVYCLYDGATVGAAGWFVVGVLVDSFLPRDRLRVGKTKWDE